ncbi:nitronate monooxygenase [Pelomonas sp. V22]|nr:nitronate monooxygenase [Pelomonas sp. V22]
MAGSQGSRLAIAVCQAGGLGSLPAAMLTPEALRRELQAIRAATDRPFNINFFCHQPPTPDEQSETRWRQRLAPFLAEFGIDPASIGAGPGRQPFNAELAEAIAEFAPPIVSFHFGLPAPELIARVKRWGAQVWSSATTVEEARWLEAHGADAVIAQGLEAGGHRGHFLSPTLSRQLGLFALLPQIVAAVKVPVIAAGGIADAAGVRAVLGLGAMAAQVGSAYLLCDEADTTALHRAALQSPGAAHTAITHLFTGRPARGIVNRLMRELGPLSEPVPAFPLATGAIAPLRAAAEARGLGDFSPLWAGQNLAGCRAVSAAEITRSLAP